MEKIPLFIYVAHNNPNGAVKVMNHFGLMPPKEETDLVVGLRYVMETYGEEGFLEIAKHHPDRSLIIDAEEINKQKLIPIIEPKPTCDVCEKNKNKSNACGCHSGLDGVEQFIAKKDEAQPTTPSLTKEDVSNEIKRALNENNSFIKDGLPYIALLGVGAFLFIGMMKTNVTM